jgi:hypothetical protein
MKMNKDAHIEMNELVLNLKSEMPKDLRTLIMHARTHDDEVYI